MVDENLKKEGWWYYWDKCCTKEEDQISSKVQVLVSHNLAVVFARPKKENIMLCATFVWLCPWQQEWWTFYWHLQNKQHKKNFQRWKTLPLPLITLCTSLVRCTGRVYTLRMRNREECHSCKLSKSDLVYIFLLQIWSHLWPVDNNFPYKFP